MTDRGNAMNGQRSKASTGESEERLRATLESITDGFISVDGQWRFTYFNAAAERICGIQRDEVLGREWKEVFSAAVGTDIERGLKRCTTEHVPVEFETFYEPWQRWFWLKAYPTPDGGFTQYFRELTQAKRDEAELIQSRRLLQELIERCPFGIYIVDSDFNVARMNHRSQEGAFANVRPLIGRNFDEVLRIVWPENVASEISQRFRHTLDTGETYYSRDFVNSRADTDQLEGYEWELHRITLADGRYGVVCYYYDSSDLRRAEQALRISEERYRTLFESIDEGFCVFDLVVDQVGRVVDYRFVEVNPAFEKHTGFVHAKGKTVREMSHGQDPPWLATCEQIVRTGEHVRSETYDQTQGRWLEVCAFPLGKREQRRIAAITTDITERKEAQRILERRHETFYNLVTNAPLGVYVVDSNFRLAHVSAGAQAVFQSVRPLIGHDFAAALRIIWPEPFATEAIGIFRRTLETGESYVAPSLTHLRQDTGETESYEWEIHRITMPDETYGVVCYYYESTMIRRAEAALREADRRKDEFLATLAHELRNPLAPIRTGLEVLKLAGDDPATREEIRGTMERQAQLMTRLIDDLLDVSRITRGRLQLRMGQVLLKDVVDRSLESVAPLVHDAGHNVRVHLPDEPLTLNADPSRLAQVLSNLLTNAAKFTPEHGEIVVAAERQGGHVVVSVKDNGPGIPPEMRDRIFDMFTQVDRSLEKQHAGLGIGLTLVKSLVEMHQGTVWVESEIGQGSTFRFKLPLSTTSESSQIETVDKPMDNVQRRVLIVDDNLDGVQMLSMMVRMHGSEVCVAHDGVAAVEQAEAFRPDVVLMDIGMPRMNGYDAARAIREQPWGKDMVLVALTGWGQDDDRRRTKEAGFDYHLVKPVEPAALAEVLGTASGHSDVLTPARSAIRS